MEFRILGDITAYRDGQVIEIGYEQLRFTLATLLVDANRSVPVDQIIGRVWEGRRLPHRPRAAVQHNMTMLRRAMADVADVRIIRCSSAYQICVDPAAVDLHRFDSLLDQARTAAHDRDAAVLFERALRLWRGDLCTGLDTAWIGSLRARLGARRDAARLDLVDVRLRMGEHDALVAELSDQAAQHPLDERLAGQYLLALYRGGRPAQALEHYHRLRHVLAEDLGTDPSPPLQRLYQRILTADSTLTIAAPTTPTPTTTPVPAPRQLPAPPHLFTGRGTELAELDRALHDQAAAGGAVVISAIGGPGGIGKTWLALHWAHQHHDRFPDGQLYVNLRGFDPSGQPTPAGEAIRGFLDGLGVHPSTLPITLDTQAALYRSLVAGKRMLIVLDNARDTAQVVPLLPGSPTCTVLVTSRHHLAGLTVHGARLLDLDVLPEPDAHDLLAGCLGRQRLAAEPTAVAELLAVCAGLPLAVQIVAARAQHHPTFALAVLADELRDVSGRLDGLDAGELRVNLRAVLSWSLRTLSPPAATLFGLLGLAPGPDISLPAAACLADLSTRQAQAVLRELEHARLVQQHTPSRYRMHDLVRLYATDTAHRDLAPGVREAALGRVLDFYIHTAYTADCLLDPPRPRIQLDPPALGVHPHPLPDIPAALAWFDDEHSALLAAQHTAARQSWRHVVWQLAWALDTFHFWRGHRHDRLAAWLVALDAATHLPDPAARILAHRRLGHAYADLGCHDEAIGNLHLALALAEEHHDTDQRARTHRILTWAWSRCGNDRQALEHAARALDLFRTLDNPVGQADALNAMGWCAARLGEYGIARTHCQDALVLHQYHHDPDGHANTLDSMGYIAHHTGHHHEAIGYYRQAITLFRAHGDTYETANTLDNLGHPYAALGEQQAHTVWREALELYHEQGRDDDAHRVQQQLDDLDNRPRCLAQQTS